MLHTRIRIGLQNGLWEPGRGAGRQEMQVADVQGRLERREKGGRRAGRKDRCRGRKVQRRLRECLVEALLFRLEADEVVLFEWCDRLELLGSREVWPRRAVGVDDAFRQ